MSGVDPTPTRTLACSYGDHGLCGGCECECHIGTPDAPTWHCWDCKWKGDHAGAVKHAEAETTHKVTRTSDTWHGHGPTDA